MQYINGPVNSKVPGGGRVIEMWGSTKVPDEAWEVMKFPLVDHEIQVGVFSILRDGLPANTNTWDDARLLEKSGRPPREVEAYMAPLREGRGQYWQVNGVWLEWRNALRGNMKPRVGAGSHSRASHAASKQRVSGCPGRILRKPGLSS